MQPPTVRLRHLDARWSVDIYVGGFDLNALRRGTDTGKGTALRLIWPSVLEALKRQNYKPMPSTDPREVDISRLAFEPLTGRSSSDPKQPDTQRPTSASVGGTALY